MCTSYINWFLKCQNRWFSRRYIASGQLNMEFSLSEIIYEKSEVENLNYLEIRFYNQKRVC